MDDLLLLIFHYHKCNKYKEKHHLILLHIILYSMTKGRRRANYGNEDCTPQ